MIYLRLFWEFFKTGLFAVGGGMATLPFLKNIGLSTGWYSQTALMNMLAVSESTPGPIGINMATYVGYEMSGVLGSISTTLGFVAPSIIIIVIVSIDFRDVRSFQRNPIQYPQRILSSIQRSSTTNTNTCRRSRSTGSVGNCHTGNLSG